MTVYVHVGTATNDLLFRGLLHTHTRALFLPRYLSLLSNLTQITCVVPKQAPMTNDGIALFVRAHYFEIGDAGGGGDPVPLILIGSKLEEGSLPIPLSPVPHWIETLQ